jgi:polyphosphate kinase
MGKKPSTRRKKKKIKDGTGSDPGLFINRELSWIQFNSRVLDEALDIRNPLLERVKFLSIFANNLDEFFMVRVSGLRGQLLSGSQDISPDGLTPAEQLIAIRHALISLFEKQATCWNSDLLPKLKGACIHILSYEDLNDQQRAYLREYFEREIFPILTPLAFDPAHPFPHISNLSLNLAVVVKDIEGDDRFARLKVPDTLPRFLNLPEEETDGSDVESLTKPQIYCLVPIEQVIASNLDLLFPGLEIHSVYPFRITRDADIEIEVDEAADLLTTIEEEVEMRHFGITVRLEVESTMPERIRNILIKNLKLDPYLVYTTDSMIGMSDLMQITKIERPDLKDPVLVPALPAIFTSSPDIFSLIRKRNILLYHPYDSFTPVVDFIRQAAKDPDVLAIKQTLYRTGQNSPFFDAFMEARSEGKQVAVLLELKARFDEETNITWARKLEDEGVHVVYGLVGMKVHAKMCMVVRRERDGIVRYVHMSTGNYNTFTSRVYADIGYFTCNPVIGEDVSDLFNALTGYSAKEDYRSLLVAPGSMRKEMLFRIEREIERQVKNGDGYLAFKMNALVDTTIIQALYRASQAGVRVDLNVRGICCLRPGLPGISDNITVDSIVGRFLEHSRIYYFRNGGEDEILLGSADMMPRNLDRRVEILFPVTNPHLKEILFRDILGIHLKDNVKARRLNADGSYIRLSPAEGEKAVDSQLWLLQHKGSWVH